MELLRTTLQNNEDEDTLSDESRQRMCLLTSLCGSIELNVLCHFPLLDPVAKATLKRTYLDDDIADVRKLSVAYETMAVVSNYKRLASEVREAVDAYGNRLTEKASQMSVKVPIRPAECLYDSLKRDVAHFMGTCAQPSALHRMIESFANLFGHQLVYADRQANVRDAEKFLAESADLVKRTELWLNNVDKFEHHTVSDAYRSHYRDFVEPLCCALAELRNGVSGLVGILVAKREAVVKLENGFFVDVNGPSVLLSGFLANLIEYPANFRLIARDIVPDFSGRRVGDLTKRPRTNVYPLLERLPNGNALLFK